MKRFFSVLLTLCLLLAGCTATPPAAEPADTALPAPSETEPAAVAWDDYSAVRGFAAALFSRIAAGKDKNPVLSPASAYLCLAMVQNGADTDTLKEFERVLGADTDTLNAMCKAYAAGLSEPAGSTVLSVANAVFSDDDRAHLTDEYLKTLTDGFGAEAFSADLPSDAAREQVNAWVNEKTRGMIPTLHAENYPEDTVLVLLNTLYLKALWQTPFPAYTTQDMDFLTVEGESVHTPFLRAFSQQMPMFDTDACRGAVLPYDDGKTAFVVLMPKDGDLRGFAAAMTGDTLSDCLSAAEDTLVNFSMPKFTAEYGTNLNATLRDMGLSLAFDAEKADLTRMGAGENGPLYLSWVIQKVKLIVDEEGTEASAVTEAAAADGAAFSEPVDLQFDRPFLYAVVDLASETPLFIGLMDDPSLSPSDAPVAEAPDTDVNLLLLLMLLHDSVFPGTAGSSLTEARFAAQILDCAAAKAVAADTASATVAAFVKTLSAEEAALFSEQLSAVYAAAQDLLTDENAAELLETAGYSPTAYPWDAAAADAFFAALMQK